MNVTQDEITDLVEVLHRMGARFGGRAVLIQMARNGMPEWTDDRFWAVANAAQEQGAIEHYRNGNVIPTLTGMRLVEARLHPPHSTTHNSVSIGTNIASPIQQTGARSTQTQTVEGDADRTGALREFVASFREAIGDLSLDPVAERRAKAQLATIDAQLEDEPNPVIVGQAGRTLRAVTEGAIGSLIATAVVNPGLWTGLMATLQNF